MTIGSATGHENVTTGRESIGTAGASTSVADGDHSSAVHGCARVSEMNGST